MADDGNRAPLQGPSARVYQSHQKQMSNQSLTQAPVRSPSVSQSNTVPAMYSINGQAMPYMYPAPYVRVAPPSAPPSANGSMQQSVQGSSSSNGPLAARSVGVGQHMPLPPPSWVYFSQPHMPPPTDVLQYGGPATTSAPMSGPQIPSYYRFVPPPPPPLIFGGPPVQKMALASNGGGPQAPPGSIRYGRPPGTYQHRSSSSISSIATITPGQAPQIPVRGVALNGSGVQLSSPYRQQAAPPMSEPSKHARKVSQSGIESTVSSSASSIRSFDGSNAGNFDAAWTPPQKQTPVSMNPAYIASPTRNDVAPSQQPKYIYPIRVATATTPKSLQPVNFQAGGVYSMMQPYDTPVSVITKQVRQGLAVSRSHSLYSARSGSVSNALNFDSSASASPNCVAITPLSAAGSTVHVIKEARWQTLHQSKALADGVKQLSPLNYVRTCALDNQTPSPILPVASLETVEALFLESLSDQLSLARVSALQNMELSISDVDQFSSFKSNKLLDLAFKRTVLFEMLDWESVDLATLEAHQEHELARVMAASEALAVRKLKKKKRREKQWGWYSIDASDDRSKIIDGKLKQHGPRGHVMANMYETERNYVRDLDTMRRYFRVKLKNMISKTSLSIIFSGIDDLYEFHRTFLAEMELIVETFSDDTGVGALFLKYKNSFSVYKTFMSSYAACQAQMRYEEKSHSEYRSFMRDCLSNPNTNRQQLRDYMILPVQRTTRYQLLLKDFLKYTPNTHGDYEQLKMALDSMQSLAAMVNDVKREEEETTAMFAAFEMTKDCPPTLISAKRRLLLSVDVVEVLLYKRPLRLFWFSDLLMMATCINDNFSDLTFDSSGSVDGDNNVGESLSAFSTQQVSNSYESIQASGTTHNALSFSSSLSSSLGTTMLNALSVSGSAVGWAKLANRETRKNQGSYFSFGSSSSLGETNSGTSQNVQNSTTGATAGVDTLKSRANYTTASAADVQKFFMGNLGPMALAGTTSAEDFSNSGPQFRFLRWIDYKDLRRHEVKDSYLETLSPARNVFLNGKIAEVTLAMRDCLLVSMDYPKYDATSLSTFLPDQHPLRRQKSVSSKSSASFNAPAQSYSRKLGAGIPQPGGEKATFAFKLMGWDSSKNRKKLDSLVLSKLSCAPNPSAETVLSGSTPASYHSSPAASPHYHSVDSPLPPLPPISTTNLYESNSVSSEGGYNVENGGNTPGYISPSLSKAAMLQQMPLPPVPPLQRPVAASFSSSSSSIANSFSSNSSLSSSRESSTHNSPIVQSKVTSSSVPLTSAPTNVIRKSTHPKPLPLAP